MDRWMDASDGWMDANDRARSIERTMRCDRAMRRERSTAERSISAEGPARDGRPPARGADGWFLLLRRTDGRTDGRTARERFENVILSDRSKPFARVEIYIRLMYGTVCMHARATVAMLSTLKNPKP